MISSTSSTNRTGGTDALSLNLAPQPPVPQPLSDQDSVSTENAEVLSNALNNQPEVRPEMVAKGLALAGDPSYPSSDIINHIAGLIVNSPDLSEDAS